MKKPKYPSPPRSMCNSFLHYILGIHSPSCELRLRMNGPKNKAEQKYYFRVMSYHEQVDQYKIFTRTMGRSEWKAYHRAARIKERQEEQGGHYKKV